MSSFVFNGHNHCNASLLDGYGTPEAHAKKAAADGYQALAITDHGNLFAAIPFTRACKAVDIKPVLGCLLRGQEIVTENGVCSIEELEVGDKILTHRGRFRRVLRTMQRKFSGKIYSIELTKTARKMTITEEHPVLIRSANGDLNWVLPGDIDYGEQERCKYTGDWKAYACLPRLAAASEYQIIDTFEDLKCETRLVVEDGVLHSTKTDHSHSWPRFPPTITLDEEFAYFLGLYTAEGHVDKDLTGSFGFTFNFKKESMLAEFVVECLAKRFGILAKQYNRQNKNTIDIVACSVPLAILLKKYCGIGAKNKRVPSLIFSAPKNVKRSYMKGLMDGDARQANVSCLKVASPDLAWGFRTLAVDTGIWTTVSSQVAELKKTSVAKNHYHWSVTYTHRAKWRRSFADKNFVYRPIKNIEAKDVQDIDVFNVEVEEDNSYVSDIALHNCELYFSPYGMSSRPNPGEKREDENLHLTLLAADDKGWLNLSYLISQAWEKGFYYRPRVDQQLLAAHAEGIICLSGCLSGPVPWYAVRGQGARALQNAGMLKEIFKDRFYMEVQPHEFSEQILANQAVLEIGRRLGVKPVLTLDSHYPNKADHLAHDVLLCVQTKAELTSADRMKFPSQEFWLKSPAEVAELSLARACPESLATTAEIAERCTFILDTETMHLPRFLDVGNLTAPELLRSLVEEGLLTRARLINRHIAQVGKTWDDYRRQALHELEVIEKAGFVDYFLIIADLVRWCRGRGIPVGPRGSVTGCLVAFLVGIHDVDPLRFDLSFERFLAYWRDDPPDADLDLSHERHHEAIQYLRDKYGADKVAHIAAIQRMQGRSGITDVMRVLGDGFMEQKRVSKMVPQSGRIKIDIKTAMELNPALAVELKARPEVLELALDLEGSPRAVSVHAGGVIITDKPVWHYLPTFTTHADDVSIEHKLTGIQADHKMIEKMLLKVDLLRLKTLDVIDRTLRSIRQMEEREVVLLDDVAYDDQETFDLFCAGRTDGIFQFESTLMRGALRDIKPRKVEELAIVNAVARPGAMAYIPLLGKRRRGEEPVAVAFPELQEILAPTSGVLIFQEQLLKSVQAVSGCSMPIADSVRRACSKKMISDMNKMKDVIVPMMIATGHGPEDSEAFFRVVAKFAEYSFNLAHAVSYSLLATWTAWLKVNYPAHFYAALLTEYSKDKNDLSRYCYAARSFGVKILDLDIQKSRREFRVERTTGGLAVRFGFCGLPGLGDAALTALDKICKGLDEKFFLGRYVSQLPVEGALMIIPSGPPDEIGLAAFVDNLPGEGYHICFGEPEEGRATELKGWGPQVQELAAKFLPGATVEFVSFPDYMNGNLVKLDARVLDRPA